MATPILLNDVMVATLSHAGGQVAHAAGARCCVASCGMAVQVARVVPALSFSTRTGFNVRQMADVYGLWRL